MGDAGSKSTDFSQSAEKRQPQIHRYLGKRSLSDSHQTLAPQWVADVWDSDSLDWKDLSAQEITKRVTGKVQSGSICLFHNAALHTPEALPSILEYFRQNGYTVVPISQLLLTGEYYMDHTGKQCRAEDSD